MLFVLQYELADHRKNQLRLIANQSATVGKSDEAEHPIFFIDDLDDVHFRIVTTDEDCWIYNLASDFKSTSVNGMPVRESRLQDGDQILAGGIIFHVQLTGVEWASPPPPQLKVDSRPQLSKSYRHQIGRCGLHVYSDNADDLQTADVMRGIHGQQIFLHLLINYKAAQQALPNWLAAEDDLFESAPTEIRQEHSLHLVTGQDLQQTQQLFLGLSERDAVTCVLTDKPPADFLREKQLFMAWFARPSLLGFHLAQASAEFVGRLMSNLHGVLTKPPGKNSWSLTANPSLAPDWRSLGFEVPPSN